MNSTNADFRTFYRSTILPVVESLEAERKKLARAIFIYGGLFLVITVFGSKPAVKNEGELPEKPIDAYANYNNGEPMPVNEPGKGSGSHIIFTLAIGAVGYFFWLKPRLSNLKNRFGAEVTGSLVKTINHDLTYEYTQGISQTELEKSKLFTQRIERFSNSDRVSGDQGSTSIIFSNIHIQQRERDSDSDRESWRTTFHGVLYKADFHKEFNGQTYVLTDKAEKNLGNLGTMIQRFNSRYGSLIKMEDVEFEKQFVVYGTDPVEVHYILTPLLMQRILLLKTMLGNIELAFVESNMYILIPRPINQFNVKLFTSLLDVDHIERQYIHLKWICRITEELNLNTRIWTKE